MRLNSQFGIGKIFLTLFLIFSILAYPVAAAGVALNLPTTIVNIIVQNDTASYFVTTLSNVPSGYDVSNATYSGWCIDASADMTRNQTFEVKLYSSLSAPGNLTDQRWDMVNYIINHKQGTANDTQMAIWHFVNLTASFTQTLTPIAQAIVNDALANGNGFVPIGGQAIAVICFPQFIIPGGPVVQNSIIEVTVPLESLTVGVTVSGNAQLIGTNTYHMDSGASATFTANVQGGSEPYLYVWYVDGVATSSNQSFTFTAQQQFAYSIYVNVMDSGSPRQQVDSLTILVTIPEYTLLAIALLGFASIPIVALIRKKRVKI